jgi:hypothetical protein
LPARPLVQLVPGSRFRRLCAGSLRHTQSIAGSPAAAHDKTPGNHASRTRVPSGVFFNGPSFSRGLHCPVFCNSDSNSFILDWKIVSAEFVFRFPGDDFCLRHPAWSVASRAVWQHGPSMLMLSLALYLLLLAKPWSIPMASVPVALAYTLRPINSTFVVIITIYVAAHHRRYLLKYLLCALPIAAAFLIYNESVYGRLLPAYFSLRPGAGPNQLMPRMPIGS